MKDFNLHGTITHRTPHTVHPVCTPHPHADIMLKYAQIAQYDDKPWEEFEMSSEHYPQWIQRDSEIVFYNNILYRLKPQPPVVQVGQTWVSRSNRQGVRVLRKPYPSEGGCGEVEKWVIGIVPDGSRNLVTTVVISELDLTYYCKLKR